MIFLSPFLSGYLFGLGFLCSLISITLVALITLAKISKRNKELKLRTKLTLEMLEKYLEKVSKKEHYSEANLIMQFIDDFKQKKPMDKFFKLYKIEVKIKYVDPEDEYENEDKDEDDERRDILGFTIQNKYFIRKR